MVAKRIIPCLDVKDGRTVKGVNFVDLRDVGDAVELGKYYAQSGADELVYLDISATREGRNTFTRLVERIADVFLVAENILNSFLAPRFTRHILPIQLLCYLILFFSFGISSYF